ncbi:MAG: BMP family ABC transporter substrate-binding protein, partial [Lachnospiraceae bacterium]|nr:BMP family ABC transporter substrate-binding protein [Lachnospiraceae bacterium]
MKNRDLLIRIIYPFMGLLVVLGILALIYNFRPVDDDDSISVGVVFIGDTNDRGWNESHYKGIVKACLDESCKIYTKLGVPEEEEPLKDAVADLVKSGCSCIFLTSYGYGQYVNGIAKNYPKVAFYDISGGGTTHNSMSYFARMYQARYLAGIVAGAASKSNVLGYVTAAPVSETIRSIDAYALGARKANPSARVVVRYTGSWDDREKEERAVRELSDAGADVITFHEDRPYAVDLADKMGLFTTGYNYVHGDYSERFLTAALINWDIIYEKVMNDYFSGRANFWDDYWMGISDDAVSLYPCSELVTEETKELVAAEEERIKTWRDVFSGEIYDNEGRRRCGKDERISDEELFDRLDWYV